ncbi:MAG: hypothetical protein KA746_11430 [Pyrinomonadaceae bacterium]|nr:hypothetical protein [Pyrinomonadaceae bacterium]MBP6214243.1 hypothetical protein [Pyrinomonadaceae bacterium]
MKTLIKSGRVVTAVDDYRADIFIDSETVTTIGGGAVVRLKNKIHHRGTEGTERFRKIL